MRIFVVLIFAAATCLVGCRPRNPTEQSSVKSAGAASHVFKVTKGDRYTGDSITFEEGKSYTVELINGLENRVFLGIQITGYREHEDSDEGTIPVDRIPIVTAVVGGKTVSQALSYLHGEAGISYSGFADPGESVTVTVSNITAEFSGFDARVMGSASEFGEVEGDDSNYDRVIDLSKHDPKTGRPKFEIDLDPRRFGFPVINGKGADADARMGAAYSINTTYFISTPGFTELAFDSDYDHGMLTGAFGNCGVRPVVTYSAANPRNLSERKSVSIGEEVFGFSNKKGDPDTYAPCRFGGEFGFYMFADEKPRLTIDLHDFKASEELMLQIAYSVVPLFGDFDQKELDITTPQFPHIDVPTDTSYVFTSIRGAVPTFGVGLGRAYLPIGITFKIPHDEVRVRLRSDFTIFNPIELFNRRTGDFSPRFAVKAPSHISRSLLRRVDENYVKLKGSAMQNARNRTKPLIRLSTGHTPGPPKYPDSYVLKKGFYELQLDSGISGLKGTAHPPEFMQVGFQLAVKKVRKIAHFDLLDDPIVKNKHGKEISELPPIFFDPKRYFYDLPEKPEPGAPSNPEEAEKKLAKFTKPAHYQKNLSNLPKPLRIKDEELPAFAILDAMEDIRNTWQQDVDKSRVPGDIKPTNWVDLNTVRACLANKATQWSDLMIHYYCQFGNARGCYTDYLRGTLQKIQADAGKGAISPQQARALAGTVRVDAFYHCALKSESYKDKIGSDTSEDSEWAWIVEGVNYDELKRLRPNPGKKENPTQAFDMLPKRAKIFRYIMEMPTYAIDFAMQQRIINLFYRVPDGGCDGRENRPPRGIDGETGKQHCATDKVLRLPMHAQGR